MFAAWLPLTLIPLDVTRRVLLTEADADEVSAAGCDELVVALLEAGVERQRAQTGLAGMAILAACGDDDTGTQGVSAGDDEGYSMLQFFAPAGALAADQPVRIPFGLGTASGAFRAEVPDTLEVALVDQDWAELDRQTLPSLGDGLPRRYYSFEATLPEGIYTAESYAAFVELQKSGGG